MLPPGPLRGVSRPTEEINSIQADKQNKDEDSPRRCGATSGATGRGRESPSQRLRRACGTVDCLLNGDALSVTVCDAAIASSCPDADRAEAVKLQDALRRLTNRIRRHAFALIDMQQETPR